MNKERYTKNLKYLQSLIGLKIKSAFQEQYFFEGKLDEESLGTLKLEFSNGKELTFDCNQDAESLNIQLGSFTDKGNLETDFKDSPYKWRIKEYLNSKQLLELGEIKKCFIELISTKYGSIQSGCKMEFGNGSYLHIWIIESDNIFYGFNKKPPYYENENLKVELKEIGIFFSNYFK